MGPELAYSWQETSPCRAPLWSEEGGAAMVQCAIQTPARVSSGTISGMPAEARRGTSHWQVSDSPQIPVRLGFPFLGL